RQVGAFALVAAIAGQREITQLILAPMLPRNDVLDLMLEKRRIRLAKPAILAPITGASAYGLTVGSGHPNAAPLAEAPSSLFARWLARSRSRQALRHTLRIPLLRAASAFPENSSQPTRRASVVAADQPEVPR